MPYRRLSGLTKAHFDEVALRYPALVATLPFDQNQVPRYVTEEVLLRTRQRWSWFSEARKINPALGTLCYLPSEVRSMIWQALLYHRESFSTDGDWEYDLNLGPPLNMSAYNFGFRRRHLSAEGIMGPRLVSSVIKLEIEESFLSKHTFRFNYAANMAGFFNGLKDTMKLRVLSIDIGICLLYAMDPWMGPLECLAPGLQRICFRLYPVFENRPTVDTIQRSLETFEKLVNKAVESAPQARISICSTTRAPLQPNFQVAADAIIERLRNNLGSKNILSVNAS